ncbi:MAG: hypothetical protein ABSB41_12170 [Anaerolineales bacterium]|jgi:hypothetical protein
MSRYDLCLAWNWEYDFGFVQLMEAACARQGMLLYQVKPDNLDQVLLALASGELSFAALHDRASDSDPRFQALVERARAGGLFCINPQERSHWACDKATMHLEFIAHGLDTPHTLLLAPFNEQPGLPALDFTPLGGSFAIKPASGGGGWGVVLQAVNRSQVEAARREYPQEKFLLQAYVTPCMLGGCPAWFRVLYCDGAVYPCWWDPQTHLYRPVTAEERFRFKLHPLREVPQRIAQICGLQLFSTEIALTEAGRFLAVDYVNDPVDLRLQSRAVDGVPDGIVENIAGRLIRLVERNRHTTTRM